MARAAQTVSLELSSKDPLYSGSAFDEKFSFMHDVRRGMSTTTEVRSTGSLGFLYWFYHILVKMCGIPRAASSTGQTSALRLRTTTTTVLGSIAEVDNYRRLL